MNKIKFVAKSINDVFEIIKEKYNCKNADELAAVLEISRGFYFEVKDGRKHLSEEKALRIAEKAGMTPESILILLAREKAASDEIRAIWDRIISGKCRIMNIM